MGGSGKRGGCAGTRSALAAVAVVAVILIALAARARWPRREGFTAQQARAVHSTAQELFGARGGGLTYSEYKTSAAERGQRADPVLFTDLRQLWQEGRLTPGEVLRVM